MGNNNDTAFHNAYQRLPGSHFPPRFPALTSPLVSLVGTSLSLRRGLFLPCANLRMHRILCNRVIRLHHAPYTVMVSPGDGFRDAQFPLGSRRIIDPRDAVSHSSRSASSTKRNAQVWRFRCSLKLRSSIAARFGSSLSNEPRHGENKRDKYRLDAVEGGLQRRVVRSDASNEIVELFGEALRRLKEVRLSYRESYFSRSVDRLGIVANYRSRGCRVFLFWSLVSSTGRSWWFYILQR